MPRFDANLDYLFLEQDGLPARIAAAAKAGFKGVEMLRPYATPAAGVKEALTAAGVEAVLINSPTDPEKGTMGHAALPGEEAVFEAEIGQALDYAAAIGAGRIHVLSGRIDPASASARDTLIANLSRAAPEAEKRGITLLIEPLNGHDQPGYFLNRAEQGAEIVEAVGHPAVRLQFDCYHTQVQQGDVLRRLEGVLDLVGHIQIAGPPARVAPDQGEVNYPWLLAESDALGYGGWIGFEYRCPEGTSAGLAWAAPYGIRAG